MGYHRKVNLQQHGDNRGSLVAIETLKDIPFQVNRVYYLFNTLIDESRGFHAHKNLEQLLVCVSGTCDLKVENNEGETLYKLNSPIEGVYIKDLVWREMHNFSKDCVLLVLASNSYSEEDYIRDYDEFKRRCLNEKHTSS
ncbi:FdtA/QdtA family cupin domain-containing protein [Shewanella sp. Isolate7]|uniref:sugar 3,4-ketoisomerase n=1 Tax=Shewanella sp. Isolate7 TaxID=2908528 RepID=UPI001EFE55A8|nr:FdtA/QdtA family cupin domain-containing protein [Shewanella sp. Isolate7]MCG9723554.1 FdtA/QdtA family cupin domain-containing protein [Shewanella sp. Isolate7]